MMPGRGAHQVVGPHFIRNPLRGTTRVTALDQRTRATGPFGSSVALIASS